MTNSNVFVVIPTIRDLEFLNEWGSEFKKCTGIIIEDHPGLEIATPAKYFNKTYHFTWADIKRDFGKDEWIFSRQNAGIRSYGFYKAYQLGADVIITLDDDCFPASSVTAGLTGYRTVPVLTRNPSKKDSRFHGNDNRRFVQQHLDNLEFKGATDWFATYPDPEFMYTRGFPYGIRAKQETVISHGLWSGALDLDAKTETRLPHLLNEKPYPPIRQVIPKNYFFPMCSMNLAFKREITPLMYFPLMGFDPQGKVWGYDRYDDIWCGVFAKKILDHLGLVVVNGSPYVEHRKASLPNENLEKEKPGLKVNEYLWKEVNKVKLTGNTIINCYQELVKKICFPNTPYFGKLRQAMSIWISLFNL